MSSINTNLSAMTALQSLKSTQSALSKTQGQISTGLRVGEASHNASYWSIATQMKSDNGAMGAVKDAIGQSKAMINTFTSAMDKTLTYLNKMKEGLVTATQPGADLAKIQTEFKAHIEGMKSAAGSASFNGQNWLAQAAPGTVNLVTSYDGVANKVNTLAIDTSKTNLFTNATAGTGGLLGDVAAIKIPTVAATEVLGVGGATPTKGTATFAIADLQFKAGNTISFSQNGAAATTYAMKDENADGTIDASDVVAGINALSAGTAAVSGTNLVLSTTASGAGQQMSATFAPSIAEALKAVDTAISKVTEGSAMLGANKALLETQEEFIATLSDSLEAGVSTFVDADMNEASTRLQALQTQQQLGVQALSIANQNSQMILKLFQ